MNEKNSFNHIKVTPSEEEDVVIRAGISQDDVRYPADDIAPAYDRSEQDEKPATGERIEADSFDSARSTSSSSERKKDAYKETTLEDIKDSKMPTVQIAIIVIAILAVIAFVVYSAMFA